MTLWIALSYRGHKVAAWQPQAWLNKAIAAFAMLWREEVKVARARRHRLRNTCGAWALKCCSPLDVVGQLSGHADPFNTAKYTRAQIRRVRDELEAAFASGPTLPHPARGTEFAKNVRN